MQDTPSVRSQLRDATRPAHARVDALFRDGLGEPGTYAGYLAGMHRFLGAVWHALPDLGTPLTLLQDDLEAIGHAVPALPEPHPVAAAETLAWRYVIDGSSLGARVLLRQVAALGVDAGRGATFLAHHAGGAAWDATCRDLDAFPPDPTGLRALCAAADRAFALAYHAFRSSLPLHRLAQSA